MQMPNGFIYRYGPYYPFRPRRFRRRFRPRIRIFPPFFFFFRGFR